MLGRTYSTLEDRNRSIGDLTMSKPAIPIPNGYDANSCKSRLEELVDSWPEKEVDLEGKDLPWPRRESIQALVKYFWDRYTTAPASSGTNQHGAFESGLLIHSTLIYDHMRALLNAWGLEKLSSSYSTALVSYFHDLGKVGDLIHDYYLPSNKDTLYPYNKNTSPEFITMSHEVRSILNLNSFGVPLLPEEIQAINYHSLGWTPDRNSLESRESILTLTLGFSDYYCARVYKI